METFAFKMPAPDGRSPARRGAPWSSRRGPVAAALACAASAAFLAQLGCAVTFVFGGQFAANLPVTPTPNLRPSRHSSIVVKVANATEVVTAEAPEHSGDADVAEAQPVAFVDEQPLEASADAEKAKLALLRLAAVGNRGLGASAEEQQRAMVLVEELERSYTPPPGLSERRQALSGSWAIAFTTSPDLTSLDQVPLPGWRTGRIGQSFSWAEGAASDDEQDATNEITFVSPIGSRVNQTVQCTWSLPTDRAMDSFKVRLTFVGSSTKLAVIAGMPFAPLPPLALPLPPAAGIFEVSYLDDEILIQRTRAGARGVNVLIRDL